MTEEDARSLMERFPGVKLAKSTLTGNDAKKIERAVQAYSTWIPQDDRYALGFHSARRELIYINTHPVAYVYHPQRHEVRASYQRLIEEGMRTHLVHALDDEVMTAITEALASTETYRIAGIDDWASVFNAQSDILYRLAEDGELDAAFFIAKHVDTLYVTSMVASSCKKASSPPSSRN